MYRIALRMNVDCKRRRSIHSTKGSVCFKCAHSGNNKTITKVYG